MPSASASEPSIAPASPPPQTQPLREPATQQAVLLPVAEVIPAAPALAPAAALRPRIDPGVAGDDAVFAADGLALFPGTPERGLSAFVTRAFADLEQVRTVQLTAHELRGIELVAFDQSDPVLNRFNITARTESAATEELQRTLRSTLFAGQLDRLRSDVQEELLLDKSVTISVAGVSLGLSLVYVLWLIRGGVLMGSYLSALPAWRVLDPLPVLSRVDDEAQEDDEALDAVAERPGNPLRSFG